MPRPKKGTPNGDLATQRWRKTIEDRYGDVTEVMTRVGALGGKVEHRETRPFYTNRELARIAGTKGGRVSRRNKQEA